MNSTPIHLRNARHEDAELLLNWKNDPISRKLSINSESIPWESHLKWFEEKLGSPNYYIKVAIDKEKKPLGYIRLEKTLSAWLIHFYVSIEHRGKGFGKLILENGIRELQKDKGNSISFKALVLKANVASAACFLACDFKKTGSIQIEEKEFLIFTKNTQK